MDRMEAILGDAFNNYDQHFESLNSKMDSLLYKMDTAWTENTALHTILYTLSGTKALSTLISATNIVTAEWANTKVCKTPAEEDTPASLTTGWGILIEDEDEHNTIQTIM
jgi:hypothetical protein